MTPADLLTLAEEARYLRRLADEIGDDERLNLPARLVTSAVLIGRATRIDAAVKVARKGARMVGNESDPASVCAPTGPGPIPVIPGEDVAP